jgi:PAS domain S-box-containing protein
MSQQSPTKTHTVYRTYLAPLAAVMVLCLAGYGIFSRIPAQNYPIFWAGFAAASVMLAAVLIWRANRQTSHLAKNDLETFYRLLAEHATDLISLLQPDGTARYVSPACEPLLGYSSEAMTGRKFSDYIHPDDTLAFQQALEQINTRNAAAQVSIRLRDKQGFYLWLETTLKATAVNSSGQVTEIIGVSRNITQRKQIEEALRSSIELYTTFIQNFPNGIVAIYDRDLRIIVTDGADFRRYQRRSDELAGKTLDEIFQPTAFAPMEAAYRAVFDGETRQFEMEYRQQIYQVYTLPVKNAEEKIIAGMVMSQNITELKRSTVELQEREKRYRILFEDSPIPLMEEDFSPIKSLFDRLRAEGVTDFRRYLEAHPQELWDCLANVEVIDANKAAMSMYDVSSKTEILGKLKSSFTATAFEAHVEGFLAVGHNARHFQHELQNNTLSGESRSIILRWSVLPGYEDTYARVLLSIQDITDLKRAAVELRENENRYRTLFEDSPVALWEEDFSPVKAYLSSLAIHDTEQLEHYLENHPHELAQHVAQVKILDVNKAVLQLYKADHKSQVLGELGRTQDLSILQVNPAPYLAMAQGKTIFETEVTNHTLTGDTLHAMLRWAVMPGYEDSYARVLVSILDMTARKQAEEALRVSDERFRHIAENVEEVLYIYNPHEDRFTYISPNYDRLYGHPYQEVYQDRLKSLEYIHPEDRERILKQLETTRFESFDAEYRIIRPDGEVRWVWARDFPIRNEKGEIYLFTGVVHDITKRKQAEKQQFELALEREKTSLLANFVHDISHDFRTPLSILVTGLYLLKKNDATGETHARVASMEEQVMRLQKLIEQMLAMSRLDNVQEYNFKDVNLNQVIEFVETLSRARVEKEGIQLIVDLDADLPIVRADDVQMHQALNNLVENAQHYTPDGGTITLRSRRGDHETVILEVQDTGIGIDSKDIPLIFERFYRADKARSTQTGGVGLGLAIVQKIVNRHNGEIEVESAPGKGSLFRLVLPAKSAQNAPALNNVNPPVSKLPT